MCVLDAQISITSDLALCRFPGVKGMASLPIQRVQREYAEERAMTIWARGRFGSTMLALTLALVTWPVMAQAQQKALRVVPQGEVKVFDPHQSQVNLTSMHAALVYDTLFSWDADMAARPQMVERWTVSDDKLLYTFTLRPGLKFSDGSPVTTRDAIATLKRLFLRDSQIQSLAQRVATLESIDDRTFTIGLKEPFRFVKSEYLPGAKLVYEKNPFYVARSEPASGFSGGKLVKVDRVEFIIIPDATVAIAALRNGEVDFIDSPSLDVVPTVADDPNIVTGEVWPIETYAVLRPNSIQPPFNNVKVGDRDHLSVELAFGHAELRRPNLLRGTQSEKSHPCAARLDDNHPLAP